MDWENKFTSILREAESNLTKTRRKINSTRAFSDRNFSMSVPMRRTTSMLEFPRPDLYTSVYSPATENVGAGTGMVHVLSERLEEQNRLIDQLRQMVSKLETDRSNYNEQIRELKNEVYKLSGRGVLNMDHKLDQVRHDLNEDIQMLNSQLQNLRTTGNNRVSDNQFYSLSKDVQDVKHSLRDDMETIKRDIDAVKSRLFKMEFDVTSAFNNGKNLQRKQDVLDQNVHELASYQQKQPFRSSQGSWSPTSDNDRLNMSELRSTVSLLRDRVGNMEAVINSQQASPRYSTPIIPNGFHLSSAIKPLTSSPKKQTSGKPLTSSPKKQTSGKPLTSSPKKQTSGKPLTSSPKKQTSGKPLTSSPKKQTSGKPLTSSPKKQTSGKPLTSSPKKQTSGKPLTSSPKKQTSGKPLTSSPKKQTSGKPLTSSPKKQTSGKPLTSSPKKQTSGKPLTSSPKKQTSGKPLTSSPKKQTSGKPLKSSPKKQTSGKPLTSPKKQISVYKTTTKLDNDLDSVDFLLSDEESSDLEIFNPKKQDIKGLDSDDDLDLDDLDLDDDMGSIDSELNDL